MKLKMQLKYFCIACLGLLSLTNCKKEEDDNTILLNGTYTVVSATFSPSVDVDNDGDLDTDALSTLENTLFSVSPCSPQTAANVLIEFANSGAFNLICKNDLSNKTKAAAWTFNATINAVIFTNISVPDPANPGQFITYPFPLTMSNVNFTNTNGIIQLNGLIENLPYTFTIPIKAANVQLVLKKES